VLTLRDILHHRIIVACIIHDNIAKLLPYSLVLNNPHYYWSNVLPLMIALNLFHSQNNLFKNARIRDIMSNNAKDRLIVGRRPYIK